ncbi:unnamed protein product, partial [Durusdinium trenchii]
EYPAASPQHSSTPTVAQVEEARVQQPTEDLGKQEQEAVHTESVAEVQQESPAASPQHSTTPTVTQVEEARVQQPAEELSKQEQEAVHTESVAEVQQESPAASPQHSTTPTITQAQCGVSSPKTFCWDIPLIARQSIRSRLQ